MCDRDATRLAYIKIIHTVRSSLKLLLLCEHDSSVGFEIYNCYLHIYLTEIILIYNKLPHATSGSNKTKELYSA